MKNKLWVVTKEYNDYNQYGEYFIAVYSEKPTFSRLKSLLLKKDPDISDVVVGKLTRGGGRHEYEYEWYNLREVNDLSPKEVV